MFRSGFFSRRDPREARARALYEGVVAQARQPGFYRDCGVPDSVDGRFELIALHAFLVLRRLKAHPGDEGELGQALFDVMFQDMDQSLRELGAGDLGVGLRVKRMAQGFFGRIAAYEDGLSGPPENLEAALRRNLYGTVSAEPEQVGAMAEYLRAAAEALTRWNPAETGVPGPEFGSPPVPSASKRDLRSAG